MYKFILLSISVFIFNISVVMGADDVVVLLKTKDNVDVSKLYEVAGTSAVCKIKPIKM